MRLPKILRLPLAFLPLGFLLVSCASAPTSGGIPTTSHASEQEPVLLREDAMFRAKQVSRIGYSLWFQLGGQADEYLGRATIRFDLRPKADEHRKSLRLDFWKGKIGALSVNGKAWDAETIAKRYDGRRIEAPIGDLKTGQNQIEIAFTRAYSENGNGLYRFQDPVDKKVYLYTNLEPFYANQVFPCFDQPDLKATYDLTVETPESWVVSANGILNGGTNKNEGKPQHVDGRLSWQFGTTLPFSTYLFGLHAGPYRVEKSDADGIPLRLLVRQSLADRLDAKEWFDVTRAGLKFYSEFFNTPYPYGKYDQIIVPDFNAGAMENVAAITFGENYVFTSKPTVDQRRERAETILHEMAHMWFGDLVTMRWWNGLWLNESFATYMASLALKDYRKFPDVDQQFFAEMKRWAYREDQSASTHPIEVSVPDTSHAFSNFDGITYGKGAAVLKQLHYLIGDEDFREGLHRYFEKFRNKNTVLADFMNVMSQASSQTLAPWEKMWLQTTGVNTLQPSFSCDDDGEIKEMKLVQTGGTLRIHHFKLGLYDASPSGRLVRRKELEEIDFPSPSAELPVAELEGKKCPDLVLPNEEDYGYFKILFDETSLAALHKGLGTIPDALARHLAWHSLWETVLDGKLKPAAYAELAFGNLQNERNDILVADILGTLHHSSADTLSIALLLAPADREAYVARLNAFARKKWETLPLGSDLQWLYFRTWMATAAKPEQAEEMKKIALKKGNLRGIALGIDRRWELLAHAARIQGYPAAEADELLKRDANNESQSYLPQLRAASPKAEDEAAAWAMFERKTEDARKQKPSFAISAMERFLTIGNPARVEAYRERYYTELARVMKTEEDTYYSGFADGLYPFGCSPESIARAKTFLDKNADAPVAVRRTIEDHILDEERCLKAR